MVCYCLEGEEESCACVCGVEGVGEGVVVRRSVLWCRVSSPIIRRWRGGKGDRRGRRTKELIEVTM